MDDKDVKFELDTDYYKQKNVDLRDFSTNDLHQHFYKYGIGEGRAGHPYAFRENFIKVIEKNKIVLEIGPFYKPLLAGDNVYYFDVLTAEELRDRAAKLSLPVDKCPAHIHFHKQNGNLTVVDRKFDFVISSHNIEHQ